jgi:thiosulfate dehydrogenase [quinone] large subunit
MENILALKNQRVPLFWISLLRIMIGLLILTTWGSNLLKGFYTPEGLLNFFTNVFPLADNPLTWYAAFIDNVILPIRHVFAPFQMIGEFLLALFLLLGLFTPLTSLFAAFFIINTYLATYGHDWPWSYWMILGILFVVFVTRAGRSLGVDNLLYNRRRDPPVPFLW